MSLHIVILCSDSTTVCMAYIPCLSVLDDGSLICSFSLALFFHYSLLKFLVWIFFLIWGKSLKIENVTVVYILTHLWFWDILYEWNWPQNLSIASFIYWSLYLYVVCELIALYSSSLQTLLLCFRGGASWGSGEALVSNRASLSLWTLLTRRTGRTSLSKSKHN